LSFFCHTNSYINSGIFCTGSSSQLPFALEFFTHKNGGNTMRTKLSVRAENFQPQQFAKIALAATLGLAITFTLSCSSGGDPDDNSGGGGKGNDISNYRTVQIGEQRWMAENINYAVSGSKCYGEGGQVRVGYDKETDTDIFTKLSNAEVQANCDKYGRLYNWATAKIVCPSGWHLPSDEEWTTLTDFVGSDAGTKLKSTSGWNNDGNGTDDHDFSALPGGLGVSNGVFAYVGDRGRWWSATEDNAAKAWYRDVYDDGAYDVGRGYRDKTELVSVRCVQD
jgi:uncharacterized protein (TIGR02145 family)